METRRSRTFAIVPLLWVLSSSAVAAQALRFLGGSIRRPYGRVRSLPSSVRKFQRVLKHCDRALEDNPGDHSTLLNRGSAHLALGNLEEALSDFDKAIKIKPEDARNYFNRALVHGAKKDHRRAIADYTEAIRIMPSLAIAYNNRGGELEIMGDVERAIAADYRQALRLAPSLAPVIGPNLQRLGAEP